MNDRREAVDRSMSHHDYSQAVGDMGMIEEFGVDTLPGRTSVQYD